MKSLELAAASAHVAFSDPNAPNAHGSLSLSSASPVLAAMAASSKSSQDMSKGVQQPEGHLADRSSLRADERARTSSHTRAPTTGWR
eukprot:3890405-Alexandrium_andersonii.AAC.1